ncbi:50S ribosomal protein L4 [Candidatus Latescibacterota bacterium]
MKSVNVYKHDGSENGVVELPENIFGIEPSPVALYQVIKANLANKRQGNAFTKVRGEVKVTKSKPYRQKGTGRARAGSANSPLWVGGSVTFGPRPRTFNEKVNKKVRVLGLKSAYSIKASEDNIFIVDDFALTEPKTKTVADVFKALGIEGKKIMFIVSGKDDVLMKSVRNIPKVKLEMAENANVYNLTNSDVLLFTKTSVDRVKDLLKNEK